LIATACVGKRGQAKSKNEKKKQNSLLSPSPFLRVTSIKSRRKVREKESKIEEWKCNGLRAGL